MDNKKFHIEVSCLASMVTNWYEINQSTVINWSTAEQSDNMKLKESLIMKFDIVV